MEDRCTRLQNEGVPIVAVNDAYRMFFNPEIIFGHDGGWWTHHQQQVLKQPGVLVTTDDGVPQPIVKHLKLTGEHGFDADPACVRHGNNSGFSALALAVHAGASKILMLGFDMRPGHFFGEHPPGLRNTKPETFARWIANFNQVAPIYAGMGVDVVMCAESALGCFRRSTLEQELA